MNICTSLGSILRPVLPGRLVASNLTLIDRPDRFIGSNVIVYWYSFALAFDVKPIARSVQTSKNRATRTAALRLPATLTMTLPLPSDLVSNWKRVAEVGRNGVCVSAGTSPTRPPIKSTFLSNREITRNNELTVRKADTYQNGAAATGKENAGKSASRYRSVAHSCEVFSRMLHKIPRRSLAASTAMVASERIPWRTKAGGRTKKEDTFKGLSEKERLRKKKGSSIKRARLHLGRSCGSAGQAA